MSTPTALVTGATGKVGRHVVHGLLEAGATVRALSRDPDRADLPPEVRVLRGDPTDPTALAGAADGADTALLVWIGFDSTGAEGPVTMLGERVAHVVQLSAADLTRGGGSVQQGVWADIEALVEQHAENHTFVRAGGFAANTLGWAGQLASSDTVRLPHPEASRSLVHEEDIAAVIVRAMLDPAHHDRTYAVTGPEALTQAQQVATIGRVLGRDLKVEEQPHEEALAELAGVMGPEFARQSLGYWASLVATPEAVSPDVERVLGRPALAYEHWVQDHLAHFDG